MDTDDRYREWLQRRARADLPEGFTDTVLASIRNDQQARRQGVGLTRWLLILYSSRASRFGIGTLAGLTCLFRMAQVIGVFLVP
jgi:hypothetical protein